MRDWETDWNRDVLERIVALLFSLAGLADLAAGAPFLRRHHVLGILSQAEAEARAFLIGISTDAPVQADASEEAGDAANLAARLRMLALLLCALLAQPLALSGAARLPVGRSGIAGPTGRQAAVSAPDTS